MKPFLKMLIKTPALQAQFNFKLPRTETILSDDTPVRVLGPAQGNTIRVAFGDTEIDLSQNDAEQVIRDIRKTAQALKAQRFGVTVN